VLGRDPDQTELEYWLNRAKTDLKAIDPVEITDYLQNLPEHSQRVTWKNNIIGGVAVFFEQYLSATNAEKETMLLELGLSLNEVEGVDLSQEDVDAILSWLESQSLHFGDSAFKSVIDLLAKEGINKTFEEIGIDCLKVDILSGVITEDTEGELVISMYAMDKVAGLNGLTLHAERINFDELKSQLAVNDSIVLHVTGNHYVVLKDINENEGTVTYRDLSVGVTGQDITMSRAEFMGEWKGYALSKNEIINTQDGDCKYLNDSQAKNIRGSGWFSKLWKSVASFFQKIVAPIASILVLTPLAPFALATLALNAVVQTVSFVAGTGTFMDVVWSGINLAAGHFAASLSGVGGAAAEAAEAGTGFFASIAETVGSIGKAIFAPIKGVFTQVASIFSPITSIVSNVATGIGNIFTPLLGEAIATSLATTVIATAVDIGASEAFESLGMNPDLTNFASALFTGAAIGGAMNIDVATSMLRSGTVAGAVELGEAAGLDPDEAHLAAVAMGAFATGSLMIDGEKYTGAQLMRDITTNIASEMAYMKVVDLGESIGIDPRISSIAGMGIRSMVNPGVDPNTGQPRTVWDGALNGLARGITSIGLNYAVQELDIDPLVANIGFATIATGIEGAINEKGIFSHMFDTYKKNAIGFLGGVDPSDPNYAWKKTAYMAQIQDFSEITREQGLEEALDTHATGFFNSTAVNAMVSIEGSIGKYIKKKLDTGHYKNKTMPDGTQAKEVEIENTGQSVYLKEKDGSHELLGFNSDEYLKYGNIVLDAEGRLKILNGYISQDYTGSLRYSMAIENGYQKSVMIIDATTGEPLYVFNPTTGKDHLIISGDGNYDSVKIEDNVNNQSWAFKDSKLMKSVLYNDTDGSKIMEFNLDDLVEQNFMFFAPHLTPDSLIGLNLTQQDIKQITNYVLLGGINNPNPSGVAAPYMDGIAQQIALADPNIVTSVSIPMFEGGDSFDDTLRNGSKWFNDVYLYSDELTDKIINGLYEKYGNNLPSDMIGIGFSGSGDPLIQALNKDHAIDMKTVIMLATPLKYDRIITNPNVEIAIMIRGEEDLIPTMGAGFFQDFNGSPNEIDTYRMRIKGIDHMEYGYDPNNPNPDPSKVKAAEFIGQVASRSKDTVKLDNFFNRQIQNGSVTYDNNLNEYVVVDLDKVDYSD